MNLLYELKHESRDILVTKSKYIASKMPYQREMYASMYNTFWRNFGKGFINGLRSIKENYQGYLKLYAIKDTTNLATKIDSKRLYEISKKINSVDYTPKSSSLLTTKYLLMENLQKNIYYKYALLPSFIPGYLDREEEFDVTNNAQHKKIILQSATPTKSDTRVSKRIDQALVSEIQAKVYYNPLVNFYTKNVQSIISPPYKTVLRQSDQNSEPEDNETYYKNNYIISPQSQKYIENIVRGFTYFLTSHCQVHPIKISQQNPRDSWNMRNM